MQGFSTSTYDVPQYSDTLGVRYMYLQKKKKKLFPALLKMGLTEQYQPIIIHQISDSTSLAWHNWVSHKDRPGHWFLRSHSVLFQNYDKNSPKRGVSLTRSGIFIPSFSQTRLTVLGMHILAGSNFYTGKDYHLKHSTVCTKDTGEFLRVVKSRWTYLRTATEQETDSTLSLALTE